MSGPSDVTYDYLLSCLDYSRDSGLMIWRVRPDNHFSTHDYARRWNSRYAGTVAGAPNSKGYLNLKIDNQSHRVHRLAWLYVTRERPIQFIDHIDGNKLNNRFENLRLATNSENQRNFPKSTRNTSGVKGVSWCNTRQKWGAYISCNGQRVNLGFFADIAAAIEARRKGENQYHGEFSYEVSQRIANLTNGVQVYGSA